MPRFYEERLFEEPCRIRPRADGGRSDLPHGVSNLGVGPGRSASQERRRTRDRCRDPASGPRHPPTNNFNGDPRAPAPDTGKIAPPKAAEKAADTKPADVVAAPSAEPNK